MQESVFMRAGVSRVTRYAASAAAERGGRLVSATRSNGIIHTMPFWGEVMAETAGRTGGAGAALRRCESIALQRPLRMFSHAWNATHSAARSGVRFRSRPVSSEIRFSR